MPSEPAPAGERPRGWRAWFDVRPGERVLLAWAWLYVFCVLSAYYVIRPIRDEMGVHGGVDKLQWLFTGTLLVMLALNPAFAALVRRYSRERFITLTYAFFMLNLALFMAALMLLTGESQQVWLGRAFFIWTSVFNLFVVSVFWALMVDIFDSGQGKRLFGILAAGATLGAMSGSTITATLVRSIGAAWLLPASIALLGVAIIAVRQLSRRSQALRHLPASAAGGEAPIGGGVLAGITHTLRSPYLLNIAAYVLLYTITSTFLYFQQASIVSGHFTDRAARTEFFARVDLLVNVLTLLVQLLLTGRLLRTAGVAFTAAVLPFISLLGFAALAIAPTLGLLVAVQVARRVGNFALARPTRELLFTVVSREDKYKAKNMIDTVVYRAGDQIGSWSYALLAAAGLGMTGIAIAALPLTVAWIANARWLGQRHRRMD
ncbi:MAG: NTP/NDP exchange transporter [Burkholderiaceae bacterium]